MRKALEGRANLVVVCEGWEDALVVEAAAVVAGC